MARTETRAALDDRGYARYGDAYRNYESRTVLQYYDAPETRAGYALLLSRRRHWPAYPSPNSWPYPVESALRAMEDRMAGALDLPSGSHVLDMGCGDGYVAIYLTGSRGWLIDGIDINKRHVMKTKKNFAGSAIAGSVRLMDYHEMSGIPDETYDGVYAMETLMHAVTPEKVLREVYRILKPGGAFVLHDYEQSLFATDEELAATPNGAARIAAKSGMQRFGAMISSYGSTPAWHTMIEGYWSSTLAEIGFEDIQDRDVFPHLLPMLRFFYLLAFLPYYCFVRPLGLELYFVNTTGAIWGWWTYTVGMQFHRQVSGRKPAAPK